jgi:broad specificity phosphatase PhoE
MSVTLTIICHASTCALRDAAFPRDEPLDPQGRAKASALAASIRRVDQAWTSPALRAVETAAALQIEATVDPTLRDIDYGTWSGRTLEEVSTADPAAVALWLTDSAAAPHGGESLADLFARIKPWLDSVCAREGRVVAITHPPVARAAIIYALNAPLLSFWRIDVGPLTRVRLRGSSGRWTLLSLSS